VKILTISLYKQLENIANDETLLPSVGQSSMTQPQLVEDRLVPLRVVSLLPLDPSIRRGSGFTPHELIATAVRNQKKIEQKTTPFFS
jgi:hypothetical protein